jgi:hypothetical protein
VQTATPVGPYGSHSALQHPPAHPIWAGSQSVPSTLQGVGDGAQRPGFEAETGAPFGEAQRPLQQSVPVKQMSFA